MKHLWTFALLLCTLFVHAQGENNMWVFGSRGGLDFNGGSVVAYQSAIGRGNMEACAAVSDATGQLLFYTDGSRVWDRADNLMPGGNTLHGRPVGSLTESAQHGAQIVPVIGEPGKYYIFSLTEWEAHANNYGGRLFYSVVDMTMNGGLGDIDPARKWVALDFNLSEKMIAIPGADCNIWLLVHDLDTNMFKAYEISAAGVGSVPVRSYAGIVGSLPGAAGIATVIKNRWWNVGQMTVSPDGTKVAAAYLAPAYVEVFDFNAATGQVSGGFVLDTMLQLTSGNSFSGVAFSGDNSKLYSSGAREPANQANNNRYIYQYDMLAGGGAAGIRASKTLVGICGINSHLRRAPDGKIYFLHNSNTDSVGVIAAPHLPVPACQYRSKEITLMAGTYSYFTLGNDYVMHRTPDTQYYRQPDLTLCTGASLQLAATAGFAGYLWDDGSTDSMRTITAAGTYHVLSLDACHPRMDTFVVVEKQQDSVSRRIDTSICVAGSLQLQVPADSAIWDDGTAGAVRTVTRPGVYYVAYESLQECQLHTDTFSVIEIDLSFDLGNDTVICGNTTYLLTPVPLFSDAAYQWHDGSDGSSLEVTATGMVTLEVAKAGCRAADSIYVRFLDLQPGLGNDTVICASDLGLFQLQVAPGTAGVLWPDGSGGGSFTIDEAGIYWVSLAEDGCETSDTVRVMSQVCTCTPVFPTAFTPNGDGKNDIFRLIYEAGCSIDQFVLRVYDRWGRVVYMTHDPASGWNGQDAGNPAEAGTYMYIARFRAGSRGIEQILKGDVSLVR